MTEALDSLKIRRNTLEHYPIVIRNINGKEVFRVTSFGNIYQNGHLIEGDDALRSAVTAFIQKMTDSMNSGCKND